jgi:hypothetical protein
MKKYLALFLLLAVTSIAVSEQKKNFRSFTNDEIHKEFVVASKVDGEPGMTENELTMKFGTGDSVSNDSQWTGGKKYIYELSDKRRMKVDILNGQVMLAVIESANGENYLLAK